MTRSVARSLCDSWATYLVECRLREAGWHLAARKWRSSF